MPDHTLDSPSTQAAPHERTNGQLARSSDPALLEHVAPRVELPKLSTAALVAIILALGALFAGLFLLGWIPHQRKLAAAKEAAAQTVESRPVVELVPVRESAPVQQVELPGDVRANQATDIFARTSGYLKPPAQGIDIGAKVKAGQVIAQIAAPEIDAQLEQAKASLEQASATVGRRKQEHDLAASTLKRYENIDPPGAIAQQELDARRSEESVAAAALKEAQLAVDAAKAAVQRLTEVQGFGTILAPFDGVISARGFDAGALISPGDTGSGRPLFTIEQLDILRVRVNVPQNYATDIRVGQPAALTVTNFPGRAFEGKVARTTGSIDPATRTLRVEVDVPNAEGLLLPGMYGQVKFQVDRPNQTIIVPTSSLVFGAGGIHVATVDNSRVVFHPVTVGRDFGVEVEILTGLERGESVVKNPGALVAGEEVQIKPVAAPK